MIIFKNVDVSFGGKRVLQYFSLELECDGITCISGPSGCGKTTLFRVIAGLCPINSGTIESGFLKPAFMFQEDRLLPWFTALQNVAAALPDGNTDTAAELLGEVGLGNEKGALPSELSGGMRRRVSLARTLAYGGDLLLLDEPFKGLEPELVAKLGSIIAKAKIPALVITHSAEEAALLGGKALRFEGPPLRAVCP